MAQNPHRSQPEVRRIAYKTLAQHRLARKNSPNTTAPAQRARHSLARRPRAAPARCTHPLARGPRQSTTLFAQQQPHQAPSVQNPPRTLALAACPVQNSPCSPEMAQFGAFSACRESFVPLWLAQHRAGRVLYRMQGRVGASHDSTTRPVRKAPEKPKGEAVVQAAAGW